MGTPLVVLAHRRFNCTQWGGPLLVPDPAQVRLAVQAECPGAETTVSLSLVPGENDTLPYTVKDTSMAKYGWLRRLSDPAAGVETMGQTFINSGSVIGDMWRGHDHGTAEDFAGFDCHPDGRFDYAYHE